MKYFNGIPNCIFKKCLKRPKGQLEAVNERTDNTIGKKQCSTKYYTDN